MHGVANGEGLRPAWRAPGEGTWLTLLPLFVHPLSLSLALLDSTLPFDKSTADMQQKTAGTKSLVQYLLNVIVGSPHK